MSKCDLELTLDRPDRTYQRGDTVRGTLHVTVNKDVRCDGLNVKYYWSTHGRGNTDWALMQEITLFQGDLVAGQRRAFNFELVVPPDAPVTYHGHYLNIDHYMELRVDIPWAFDVKQVEEILVVPGQPLFAPPMDATTHTSTRRGVIPLLIGLALVAGGLGATFGRPTLLPLILALVGVVIGLWGVVRMMSAMRVGRVTVDVDPAAITPGQGTRVALTLQP